MSREIEQQLQALSGLHKRMLGEFGKVIVGQQEVLEELLITVFAGGHNLLEGVPGLAKTLMINTLAKLLSLDFKRIQFTPDLMPSDIVGTNVIEEDHTTGKRVMVFVPGPIFTNVLLADEINRTPPKTQAALLQAMQEKEVTAGGKTYRPGAPLLRPGHAKPDRPGRDLPASRGPEGPLPAQHLYQVSPAPRGRGNRRTDDQQRSSRCASDVRPRRRCFASSSSSAAFPCRRHVTGYAVDLVRATPPGGTRRPRVHQGAGRLGRRPARQPGINPLRQVPCRPRRPHQRLVRRRPPPCPARAAPPPAGQLRRRGGRHHHRHDHSPVAGEDPRTH